MAETIQENISQLHSSLSDYIEATYHISDPALIKQRQNLLSTSGVIHQIPYLESTPRYQTGEKFAEMKDLPKAALKIFSRLTQVEGELPQLLYDPPYKHQAEAIQHSLISGKNLVIMTGTGSGKTESFLLPIMGKLAREAEAKPDDFGGHPAMRALLLYPMNALVNDQLGRLRSLFGDPRLVQQFKSWCGRPPRFARYTSRTPYAGVRTGDKDRQRLKAFENFYVDIERRTKSSDLEERAEATRLRTALKDSGKWPAKPDLSAWYGDGGSYWQNGKTKEFLRAITLPDDSELLTRHEIQASPPDLLVTNYSMLEYMLMRPVERQIFDRTREWLQNNQEERFLVVLDEAHLYRGSSGAEVAMLLRRLRDRLGIPPDRFQIICATASFNDQNYAPVFGAQLTGTLESSFEAVTGTLDLRPNAAAGTKADAEVLAAVKLDLYYNAISDTERLNVLQPLLEHRKVRGVHTPEVALFHALHDFEPMGLLINETMKEARPVADLGSHIFPETASSTADAALNSLMALGSIARLDQKSPGLLPCRIHNFFRGLPGLWVCMDPDCSELGEGLKSGICGKMYSQPRERCGCGARVLELYTCRNCGTAHARAYTDDVDSPSALWSEKGEALRLSREDTSPLLTLDLLLEDPKFDELAELADFDLETGRLNPRTLGRRSRSVYIRTSRVSETSDEDDEADTTFENRGEFKPCAVCGKTARFGRTYVQDHQTKGDQPFQALVARQIQIQPPGSAAPSRFSPLQGRKVLAFSDSRQVAARLAPNLQMYSVRDSLRPLIAWGFSRLQEVNRLQRNLSLDDLYFAVLLASNKLNVRLRPELKVAETFAEDIIQRAADNGDTEDEDGLRDLLMELRSERPPEALLESIVTTIQDRFWGFEALALASIVERSQHSTELEKLPQIAGVAETPEGKLSLVRAWLRCWNNHGFWLSNMPGGWANRSRSDGVSVKTRNPRTKFKAFEKILPDQTAKKIFNEKWLPTLLEKFTEETESNQRRLRGNQLSLKFGGEWVTCRSCKSVHRPIVGVSICFDCQSGDTRNLDPDTDDVFLARKGFYRKPVIEALQASPRRPMSLIAAEHTAQLNAPQSDDVFSKAEMNELLFQDIELGNREMAIDVLSSTTTMEVGIDLGALSGVALRNMPPGRANYQQRAGRAGRRGNAVATVVAFGSSDSHDEHYFSNPDGMIRGSVIDPVLTLDNHDIARRHIRAFLLQNYHQDRLPDINPDQNHDLFSVLGNVSDFRNGEAILNRDDFENWLIEHEAQLQDRLKSWLPHELCQKTRENLISEMVTDCISAVDEAIRQDREEVDVESKTEESVEQFEEVGDEQPARASRPDKLLDRLLYCGKLPRYAFPTDVATFHVFDRDRSSWFRPIMRFAPSQGLPVALSQYAPGKQVWISGKCYTSKAIYSFMPDERYQSYQDQQVYRHCNQCGYAKTDAFGTVSLGAVSDCPACGGSQSFGPARRWIRPPGFAHPIGEDPVTSPDDMPETSYATRAKLTMGTPDDDAGWISVSNRIRALGTRQHLLVSNTGPEDEGYTYCTSCGRIEATSDRNSSLTVPHPKPFPSQDGKSECGEPKTVRNLVLGTDFITDIVLFSLRVDAPVKLRPGKTATAVALRTLSEALAQAASQLLEIEPGELLAEYRPALTPAGAHGFEAEIFLYDTLPGGAGFASQLADRGDELFRRALSLMQSCPEDCDASCYRCLRSFKNKLEHSVLDRHVGVQLLEYLITGDAVGFNRERLQNSTRLLANDLERQSDGNFTFELDAAVETEGGTIIAPILASAPGDRQAIIALSGALTDDHPADLEVAAFRESGPSIRILVENEMVVRLNLPFVTRRVQQEIGE